MSAGEAPGQEAQDRRRGGPGRAILAVPDDGTPERPKLTADLVMATGDEVNLEESKSPGGLEGSVSQRCILRVRVPL